MAEYNPRDEFWDPEYAGLDMPRDTDPDAGTPEWRDRQRRWREGSQKKDRNVERYLEQQAQEGVDSDTALQNAGFFDESDQGRATFRRYGNNGLFATQGAAVDPNLDYDWGRGVATWRAGTDNAGQSRPINATEREEYAKAQRYRAAGLQGYGQMQNAEKFKQFGRNQFALDQASGKLWNQRPDGTFEWKDQYGRTTAPPKGWTPPPGVGSGTSGPPPLPGGYLPGIGGGEGDTPYIQGSDFSQSQSQPQGAVANYNSMWSGLATGQPSMPTQGYSADSSAPTFASARADMSKAEATDEASPYKTLGKKNQYGTGSWGATTPGGSNAGLKVGS